MWSGQRLSCGCTEVSVTLSVRGKDRRGGLESEKEVGSAALVQLLIWFSISRTCQRALLSSLTVDWLPRNVLLSLTRSLSLSYSLCTELACFGVLLSHIFAHGLTKCAEKRRQHFVYFCTQPATTIKTSSTRQHMAFHADDDGDDKWAKCTQKYQNIWYI